MMTWYKEADKKTRRVFWTCSAGWAMDTADALVYQYMIPLLIVALGMTLAQAGAIASANYFAAALGGWVGGWLCDRYGRARVLRLTILWFSVFSFASGFAQTYEQLLVIRVLQGLGFGAEWAVGAVLLGELISPKHRGKALGTVHSGAAIGSGIAALLAGPFAALFDPDLGWRIVFWIGILPAMLIFFVRKGSDDSEMFRQAVQKAKESGQTMSLASIFRPKVLRITLLASLLSLGTQGAAYSVSNYLTPFLSMERGLSISMAGLCVMFNSLGGFFGFLTNAYLSDMLGRRGVFRLFGAGFIITSSIYLFAPLGGSVILLIPTGLIYGFFQFGMYASFGPYFTELFPTELRGSGQAFAYNFGRAAAALFIMAVALASQTMVLSAAMAIFGIVGIACAMTATFFLPETAGRQLHGLDDLDGDEAGAPAAPPAVAKS
ncbi:MULTISPECIES: MFS transporter [Sphingobium]|uniref:MFS family permease n=1 Tax=Sphingobium lignivorans TaxID=2735886 RepID=A0ABR6NDP5_9SPHN|nr:MULTISPECIES: MFS transporter [Sphingobium]MBB5985176.1 MFS family permease [Sphingobium lignivorans]BAK65886.1 major facilitator superfamily protein [Sphingobium sp. SYK-6]